MSFKSPVSGLIKYLSKMEGVASKEVAGNKKLHYLLDGGKLPVIYIQERHRSCYNAWEVPETPLKEGKSFPLA